jgi:hypothetical protein
MLERVNAPQGSEVMDSGVMDSGMLVQLFLGFLWALGCALFVTFLLEFREDRSTHPSYPDRTQAAKPASKTETREIGSVTIAAENSASPSHASQGNSSRCERPLYAKANQGNAG